MNKKILITILILAVAAIAVVYIYKNNQKTSMTDTATTTAQTMDLEDDKVSENGDLVVVHYTGTLENGTKFDSSYDRGEPIAFLLGKGMVIKGWDEALVGVKKGDKKHLVIPGDKAYGEQEIKGPDGKVLIPKNATLVFDLEVVQIVSAKKVEEMMKQQQDAQAAGMTAGTSTN